MGNLKSLYNREGKKNVENGATLGRMEPTRISETIVPLYKRLWIDPMYFRWITTMVINIGVFVTFGIVGDFSMFYIFLQREFDWSVSELSWVGALPWCLLAIFSPLSNQIVHHFGFRATMIGACLVSAVALFSTSFVHELWLIFLTYSLTFGGSSVVIFTTGCVYVTKYFDKKHCAGPVSSNGLAFEIAILIFSPVIQTTASAWSWRGSIRLLSSFTLCATALFVLFIRNPPDDLFNECDDEVGNTREQSNNDEGAVEPQIDAVDGQVRREQKVEVEREKENWKASFKRYIELLKMPAFSLLFIGNIISYSALSFNNINLGSYMTSVGVSDEKTAILHSFLAGGSVFARILVLFVHLLPFSITLIFPFIAIISCLVSVSVLMVTPHWVFYIYAILIGAMRGFYLALTAGVTVELSGKERTAEGYALVHGGGGIGSALAAVLSGSTHQHTGSYKLTMTLCAAIWGLSAIIFFMVYLLNKRTQEKQTEHSSKSNVDKLRKNSESAHEPHIRSRSTAHTIVV